MFVQIKNENYAYAVATYGDYVVVANPAITRYDPASASVFHTGSVDYFRYNKRTDEHDYIATLYKTSIDLLLATELINVPPTASITTELSGSVYPTASFILDTRTLNIEDGFGLSLDMYNKLLVVGCPYYSQSYISNTINIQSSGSSVDLYDLSLTEPFTYVVPDPFIYTIEDPDKLTNTFGKAVSINSDWLAVGSPYVSSSNGMVYMYKNISTENNYSWSLYQKIENTNSIAGAEFGHSLKLNKASGSYSSSMVIGCGNILNAKVYYYEFINNTWTPTYVFVPDYTVMPMTFADYIPYGTVMNTANGFGNSVSIYGDSVIIGEYLDRSFYEFSGSSLYQEGSVYIFEKCTNKPYTLFDQVFKSYGTPLTLRNNYAGFSVDIFGNNAVAGIPKTNALTLTSCDVGGTIEQLHFCSTGSQSLITGQAMLIQKNTSSNNWEITNVYQKKKKFLSPFRTYGFDVAIADRSMVVGAPMYLADSNRQINITVTESNDIVLDDVCGKSYIYNLKNLRNEFHIGNVFYRNGKIVIMTSGSVFDGLFFNPVNTYTYEYDLQFKSQYTIFEKQIVCSVNPGEFNVSTNPTSIIKSTSSLDINGNGIFDFQDLDIVMRYMQYKNTSILGTVISTDWSSSIVSTDDEISLLNYYQSTTDSLNTSQLTSESIVRWETTDTQMQDILDLNDDNKIDIRDMNIMWKYYTNRLNQKNYSTYITPSCNRKLFSDIMDYMDILSQKNAKPMIDPLFLDYERLATLDKTGSYLCPFVTTIGLYSGLDLVCVAKLGTPIKITPELPYNICIKMDF